MMTVTSLYYSKSFLCTTPQAGDISAMEHLLAESRTVQPLSER